MDHINITGKQYKAATCHDLGGRRSLVETPCYGELPPKFIPSGLERRSPLDSISRTATPQGEKGGEVSPQEAAKK